MTQSSNTLKSYFQTGDIPTQNQFSDLIDTMFALGSTASGNGTQGPQGPTGTNGSQGPVGPQGNNGANGINGATGSQGPSGTNGLQGPTGPQGFQGPIGPQGFQGNTGSNGTNGINGATGPQGPNGTTGNVGVQGAQGVGGPAGPMGTGLSPIHVDVRRGINFGLTGSTVITPVPPVSSSFMVIQYIDVVVMGASAGITPPLVNFGWTSSTQYSDYAQSFSFNNFGVVIPAPGQSWVVTHQPQLYSFVNSNLILPVVCNVIQASITNLICDIYITYKFDNLL